MSQSEPILLNANCARSRPTARAEAALTHPATLLALATLLVNDLVFKWLWPGSWITGKLSDLAWVIFASPLLALPLTFLARRNRNAQKAAWAIAYIGLPLLYAAYNTFEPLHGAVMEVFATLRGTPHSSPFDQSDSIVIPFAVGIALWVWRNRNANFRTTRIRLALLVGTVACVASIASSVVTSQGITAVGLMNNGIIVARESSGGYRYLISTDGGFNWTGVDYDAVSDIDWGTNSAITARGEFVIQGREVTQNIEGVETIVYSPPIDDQIRHRRAIRAATTHLGSSRSILTEPGAIIYDALSQNVVTAMHTQGVLVQTPDASWHQVAVSDYKPIDFAPIAVLKRINGSDFWMLALAASLSTVALSLSFALLGHRTKNKKGLLLWVSVVSTTFAFISLCGFSDRFEPNSVVDLFEDVAVPAATISTLISSSVIVMLWPRRKYWFASSLAFLLMFAFCYLCFYLWMGGYTSFEVAKISLCGLVLVTGTTLSFWVRNDFLTFDHLRSWYP